MTIHPPSYLGDHFSPALLTLALPYQILPHPLTLLWLLQLALAAGAFAVYGLARRWLPPAGALAIGIAYLLNPFTQNLSLFEFHFLAFAVPLLLAATAAWQQRRLKSFLLIAALALLVREDVALVVGAFAVLGLVERRRVRWVVPPLLMSLAWLLFSFAVIGAVAPDGSYKFGIYYGWLGDSLPEVIATAVLRPDLVAVHLLRLGNLELVLGLLLPFAFLPVWRLRALILALPPLAQMALGAPGGSELVLKTQYTALFLPGLWLAFTAATAALRNATLRLPRWIPPTLADRRFLFALVAVAVVYSSLTLGPLPGTVQLMASQGWLAPKNQRLNALLRQIPPDAAVAASYAALPAVAARPQVASLGLAFIGRLQLSQFSYAMPPETSHVVFDLNDLLTYQLQYQRHFLFHEAYVGAARRISERLERDGFAPVALADTTVLLVRGAKRSLRFSEFHAEPPAGLRGTAQQVEPGLEFLGYQVGTTAPGPWLAAEQLPLQFYWQSANMAGQPHYLQLTQDGQTVSPLLPLSAGFLELPDWPAGAVVETRHWFNADELRVDTRLELTVATVQDGGLYLTPDRSTEVRVTNRTLVGSPISLGTLQELMAKP